MARTLRWLYSTGDPDRSRVQRALKALDQDGLIKKRGGRWEPTKAGRERAGSLPEIHEPTEQPF